MAKLGISTGIVPDDGNGDSLLDGAIKINSNFDDIYTYFGDGTNLTFTGGGVSSQWVTTGVGIHTLSNVGIGTTNPRFILEVGAVGASGTTLFVNGDARVTGILTVGTASITLDGTTNIINVGSGVTINGSTGTIEASSIVIEGTTLTGVAVTSITAGSGISVDQSTGNVTITATGGGLSGIATDSERLNGELPNYYLDYNNFTNTPTNLSDFSNNVGFITTFTDTNYWEQTSAGIHTLSNVGIGTTNPTSALTVKGNTSLETLTVSGVSTFNNNITVAGIVTTDSVLFTNGGGSSTNGSLLIDNVGGSYSQLTFRDSFGTDQSNIQGISNILYINSGFNGYTSISPYSIFNQNGDVILNNGSVGTTLIRNQVHVQSGITSFYDDVSIGGTTFTNQLSVSGVSTLGTVQISSGIVTATSGIVTYYGDTSNAADGRWTLGASGTSDYTFTGIGFTQTTNDPVLYLARGRVYEFVNNSGGSHPFEIRVSNGGAAYNDGVTNNAAAIGVIRFEIPFNAPNTLYYQCTVHSGMGNTISVYPSTI